MEAKDVAAILQELSESMPEDTVSILESLAVKIPKAADDFVADVMSIYQATMDIYSPAEAAYRTALLVTEHSPTGGYSTSTNR